MSTPGLVNSHFSKEKTLTFGGVYSRLMTRCGGFGIQRWLRWLADFGIFVTINSGTIRPVEMIYLENIGIRTIFLGNG